MEGALSAKYDLVLGTQASGTTTASTAWADLETFRSIEFLVPIDTAAAGARVEIALRQATSATGTDAVELGTFTAEDPGDGRLLVAEIVRPEPHQGRWFSVEIRRTGAASALGPVLVRRHGARSYPTEPGASTVGRLVLVSPEAA